MQKKGISLIVLVITIIVMIILAGAVIISLSNSGIIGNANRAVKTSNEATVKELAQMAWLDAYADGVRSVEDEGVTKGFKTRVEDTLRQNGINLEDYLINVTTSGVTVKSIDKAWIKDGFTVKKGDKVLEIGDIVNYDETAGKADTGLTQTQWQVLGADDEGNLLILSTENVDSVTLGERGNLTKCQQDWLNGPKILNTACNPYGYGEGAVGKARSMMVEDVNKITGYYPEYGGNDGRPFNAGDTSQYGNKVTFKYGGIDEGDGRYNDLKIVIEGTNGVGDITQIISYEPPYSKVFYYYDGKEVKCITDLETGPIGTAFAEITNTDYYYTASNYISSTENPKVYEMLFGNNDKAYWLASSFDVATSEAALYFGLRQIKNGMAQSDYLWSSDGDANSLEYGVRAVVTLSSDIEFTGTSEAGWSY